MTQFEIGKRDGMAAAIRVWVTKNSRERTIYLNQYFHFRNVFPRNDYSDGFVSGFQLTTMKYGDSQ